MLDRFRRTVMGGGVETSWNRAANGECRQSRCRDVPALCRKVIA
jgi:hypothetical protein